MDQIKPLRLGDFGQEEAANKASAKKGDDIIHNFSESESMGIVTKGTSLFYLILLIAGLVTGFVLSSNKNLASVVTQKNVSSTGKSYAKGEIIGSKDEKTYTDMAEGVLKEGGIEGEGEYHLERPGGTSQNVYLTSSVLDLSEFVGMKVKIWGKTQAAQKAGWLMDAGRLQVQ